jgi:small subunit ribosomal protein S2
MKITLKQIIAVGIHLGHPKFQWHPKIAPYIYGVQDGDHLIDLVQTRKKIKEARQFVIEVARKGQSVLFVGTKSQAALAIKEVACASQSVFVNERWLGGILTNWSTIQTSLLQLHHLEREKEKGTWESIPKKKIAFFRKRLNRLNRYLGGLKGIRFLPSVVVIVGLTTESVAVQECSKLSITKICRLDTDCNPNLVEIGVPINDDSERRIRLFLDTMTPRIHTGRRLWIVQKAKKTKLKPLK